MTRRSQISPPYYYSVGSRAEHRRIATFRRRWALVREAFNTRLWPVPLLTIVLAVFLGIVLPILDAVIDSQLPDPVVALLFNGGPESARAVLSTIAGSLITATSLTFSLTVVALQLASNQASPRLLRLFASDRMVHGTLATFLGTFTFSLMVLRSVQNSTNESAAAVPRISITLCVLLTLTSVIMLTVFLAHLARQLRVETMLRNVHRETKRTIDLVRATTEDGPTEVPDGIRPEHVNTVAATRSGFLHSASRSRVVSLATDLDIVVEEEHSIGASVIAGVPVVSWWPRTGELPDDFDEEAFARVVRSAYSTGYERTSSQDIGFGLRQLVDIATRALSPGVNDPTTAVHALSHISAVLCQIVQLPTQPAALLDDDGTVRLIVRPHRFDALLNLAVQQPRRYGAADPDVVSRLFLLLREVTINTDKPHHRELIRAQSERLQASVAAIEYDETERERFRMLAASVDLAMAAELPA
ncbi:MAG: DUF2254 domain-containing protein [Microbacteriaceae bacterium]|nr:DUF2254 domain-containing protein [Microbacteriaceae bacterium]